MIRRVLAALTRRTPTLPIDVLAAAPLSVPEAQRFLADARPRDAFDDALDEPIPYALTGKVARPFPGAGKVADDELLAIARGAGLLPTSCPHDVAGLVPTPDATIWCDPATGAMVRVPAAARAVADPAGVTLPPAGSDSTIPSLVLLDAAEAAAEAVSDR